MRADDLMAAVFPDQAACPENLTGEVRIPDHPLVKETIDNCLYEAMDLEGLRELLRRIEDGPDSDRRDRHARALAVLARDSQRESVRLPRRRAARRTPRARGADAPHAAAPIVARRRGRARSRRRSRRLRRRRGRRCATPTSCTRRCCGMSLLPACAECGRGFFGELVAAGRAATLTMDGRDFWVPAERLDLVRRVYPQAAIGSARSRPPALRARSRNRARRAPPKSCAAGSNAPVRCARPDCRAIWRMPRDLVDQALAQLEAEGQILRGHFTRSAAGAKWNGAIAACWRASTG